jgi:hypothetical protein
MRMLRAKKPYADRDTGISHFHADPHGKASICKVGRPSALPVRQLVLVPTWVPAREECPHGSERAGRGGIRPAGGLPD